LKTLISVTLSLPLLVAWPSSAQISTQTPLSAESARIQNIAPVQPWTGAEAKEIWITSSAAQNAGTNFDAALGQLAFKIAGPLDKERVKRVIVADLLDPNGRSHPVGRFLADRLSAVLVRDYPSLETISFSHSQSVLNDSVDRNEEEPLQETRKWAKKLGARVVITGSFAKAPEGIGISLAAMKTNSGQTYTQTSGWSQFRKRLAPSLPDRSLHPRLESQGQALEVSPFPFVFTARYQSIQTKRGRQKTKEQSLSRSW
jgi:hypothetical protein